MRGLFGSVKDCVSKILPDKLYLSILFRYHMGYWMDWDNPTTFSEKLQWLKIYDRNPLYTRLVDKFAVKEYVASIIGEEYIIPTLGVWDRVEDIEWDKLPQQFVLKTTHGGGSMGVVICTDKVYFDKKKAIKQLRGSLKTDLYVVWKEWPYKNVTPRIIAELYMGDETGEALKDYKFFCFDGVPKIVQVDYGRFVNHKRNLYDIEWNRLPFSLGFPTDWDCEIEKPEALGEMIDMVKRLSKGIPHVRVDLYYIDGKVYFGEMTFYHGSGFEKFTPEEYNKFFGELIFLKN